jgi:hypothetical protein
MCASSYVFNSNKLRLRSATGAGYNIKEQSGVYDRLILSLGLRK